MDASDTSSRPVQSGGIVREGLVAADAHSRPAVRRVGRVSSEGVQAAADTATGSRLLGKEERREDDEETLAIASAA